MPRSWIHARFDFSVPIPELILAPALLFAACVFLSNRFSLQSHGLFSLGVPISIVLPVIAVLTSAVVSDQFRSFSFFGGFSPLPRLAGNLVIFWIAAQIPRARITGICRWWVIAASVIATNALIRIGTEPEFVSTFGNRNFLAVYLAASVVIAISIRRPWSIAAAVLFVVAMLFCHSRGAWLSLTVVLSLWFLACGNEFLRSWVSRALLVLFLVVATTFFAAPYILRQWDNDVRPMIWRSTLRMIAAKPILGQGLGTYVAAYPRYRVPEYFLRHKSTNVTDHAHNELLEIAAEQGVVGLAAMMWLWLAILNRGRQQCFRGVPSETKANFGVFGATLLFMLHSLVDIDLRFLPNQSLFWLLLGLVVADSAPLPHQHLLSFHSVLVRRSLAAICILGGLCVFVNAVLDPLVAEWNDRQARLAEEKSDWVGVTEFCVDALRFEPFRLTTDYLLAQALSKLPGSNSYNAAIEQCLQIEKIAPDYADVTYNLGQLYLAGGKAEAALPYLRRAVEINPYDPARRVVLSAALQALGKDAEAKRELEQSSRTPGSLQDSFKDSRNSKSRF